MKNLEGIDEIIERFERSAEYQRTHRDLSGCHEFKQIAEWLKELKAYKEQEPCDDAISREAALEAILTRVPDFCGGDEGGNLVGRNETASYIRNLPSVTPKQKTGEWIELKDHKPEAYEDVLVRDRRKLMQIVIDIGEDTYKARQHWVANQKRTVDEVDIAIANGIPLPKGHGRLIDADALYGQFEYADYDFDKTMEYAPTIIEADRSEET